MFCKLGFHSICTLARTKPNPALMMDHDLHAQTLIFHYLLHTCFITHLMDDIPRFIDEQHLRIDLFSRLISSALFIHTFHDLLSSTGWRRCIGCLNSQVSFRKRATNHRALLQKMTYEAKGTYASSQPISATAHRSMTHLINNIPRLFKYTHLFIHIFSITYAHIYVSIII